MIVIHNLQEQLCSDALTSVRAADLSSFTVYPAEGMKLPYFSALDLLIPTLLARTRGMLELDVKVLLLL
jgi:hypothetical protein